MCIGLTGTELADIQSLWTSFGSGTARASFSIVPNGVHLHEFDSPPDTPDFRERYRLGRRADCSFHSDACMLVRESMCSLSAHSKRRQCGGVAPADRRTRRRHAGILTQPSLDGDSRIVFTSYLDGEDRIGALAASDIFALPATGEGQPLAALEAMAASLPLVLSPGCNMDEVAAATAQAMLLDPSGGRFRQKSCGRY